MSLKKYFAAAAAVAALGFGLVACGGGGNAEEATTTLSVSYSTGCVKDSDKPTSTIAQVTVTATVSAGTTTVTNVIAAGKTATAVASVTRYSDLGCVTQDKTYAATGLVTVADGTKTLTTTFRDTWVGGSVTKTGQKATFKVETFSAGGGVTLPGMPVGNTFNFVFVDEDTKLYFGKGHSDTDGYPKDLYVSPLNKL